MEIGKFSRLGLSAAAAAFVLSGCTSSNGTKSNGSTRTPAKSTIPGTGGEHCIRLPGPLTRSGQIYLPVAGWTQDSYAVIIGYPKPKETIVEQVVANQQQPVKEYTLNAAGWHAGHNLTLHFNDPDPGVNVEININTVNRPGVNAPVNAITAIACRNSITA